MSLFQSFLNSHNFISTVGRHRKTAKAKDTSLVTKDGPGLEMLVKFFLFFFKKSFHITYLGQALIPHGGMSLPRMKNSSDIQGTNACFIYSQKVPLWDYPFQSMV